MDKHDEVEKQSFHSQRFEVSDEFKKVLDECQGENGLHKLGACLSNILSEAKCPRFFGYISFDTRITRTHS